jgi:hypothetical protein
VQDVEHRQQSFLLRDRFGTLSAPVADPRTWLTWSGGTLWQLAEASSRGRSLPAGQLDEAWMAVLVHAIEDAGCANPDLLAYCRTPGPHVRGCWVIGLLLGRG